MNYTKLKSIFKCLYMIFIVFNINELPFYINIKRNLNNKVKINKKV